MKNDKIDHIGMVWRDVHMKERVVNTITWQSNMTIYDLGRSQRRAYQCSPALYDDDDDDIINVLCCWLWLNRLKFILPLRALFYKLSYFHCRCFVENFAKFVCRSFVHSSFAAYDFEMNVRRTVYNQHWMQSPSILHTSKSKKNTQNERDEENKTKRRNNTLQWYLCSTHSEQHEIDIVGHEAYARLIIQYNALRI